MSEYWNYIFRLNNLSHAELSYQYHRDHCSSWWKQRLTPAV